MKFDSIITFLFIIAFFVLPSILKQIQAGKKKTDAPQTSQKIPSIFGRIGERIQQFVQNLEDQARQQRQAGEDQDIVWDQLAEEELAPQFESVDEDTDFNKIETETVEVPEGTKIQQKPSVPESSIAVPVLQTCGKWNYRLKSNPLQNAVIWSEILSKPIALRDK